MDALTVSCALVSTALYCGTLYAGFVYDDRRAILTNVDLLPSTPWRRLLEDDFWGTPLRERGSHGSYRPLCVATFRLNHLFGGFDPLGYHAVNVALHAICSGLVAGLARRVLPSGDKLAHAVAALLFAVHPIHSEAVAGVVGRADVLACLLTLTAFLAYDNHCRETRPSGPLLLAVLSSILATLAKETGIAALPLCLLREICHGDVDAIPRKGRRWSRRRSVLTLSGCSVLLLIARLRVGGAPPEFATADNPTARHPSRIARGLTFLYLPAACARMLLCPDTLSFDWSMDAVPRIATLRDSRNLESACLYAALLGAGLWAARGLRRPHPVDPGSGLASYPYGPVAVAGYSYGPASSTSSSTYSYSYAYPGAASRCPRCPVCSGRRAGGCHTDRCRAANNNNNGPSGECYCPKAGRQRTGRPSRAAATAVLLSLGFLVLPFLPASNLFFYVGFVIAERVLYLPSVGACLLVGAAVSGCHRLARRASGTKARLVLVATALLLGLMSAKTLRRNADWHDEESLYRSALLVNPPKAFGNLGSVLSAQGRVDEAEEAFVQALRHRPNMADVHYNLGILQQGRRDFDAAILSYQRAIHFRPSLAQAYVNLGAALVSAGRATEAAGVLRAGASLDGSGLKDRRAHEAAKVQALLQLGALYTDQGRLRRALAAYREALHTLPEHYPPESSRVTEAERWFLRALRLAPEDPSVHHHYGAFLTAQGRLAEAAEEQVRAAELARADYELSVAAAAALRQVDRLAEAEAWYRHAAALRPLEARSHTNLGAILHLSGKYRQAAAAYGEALRLRPDDETALTNLHKLAALLA
ncbi:transmembrane and TPR repeat-containing protein CG4341 isoform X2 [Orussus abietinus]|uniref:transmembrane and TPR repeat-containing protein CG4341 isoform X2 n=1 Tax=Orussus abietinus TaxID=222816 RepID=UPI0006261692|nr:transmembrane and TPR repeat-containing protein CG4341 isoform X2 [Orussus abietinus]